MIVPGHLRFIFIDRKFLANWRKKTPQLATCAMCVDDTGYHPQALTPIAPATAEATAMMILRITSQVDFFMMLTV